jgi:hypothetical protein
MKKPVDIKSFTRKIFKGNEIKETEIIACRYETTNKISVKIPQKYVDKLALEMANAGAGIIGNYESCSFRINGTGSFKPAAKSNPFSGKKNKINFVEEVKLEMRCADEKIDDVVNAIYKYHPYEEPDYDITQIKFRSKIPETLLIKLKKSITAEELFKRINRNIQSYLSNKKISSVLITSGAEPLNSKANAVIFACEPIKLKLNNKI